MPLFHKQFSDEVFASTELGNVVRMTSKAKYSPLPCLSAEIERNLISQRTKEALARKKAEGVILGRPKGSKNMKKSLVDRRQRLEIVKYYYQIKHVCIVCFAGQPDEHAGATPCKLKCLCITKKLYAS